MKLDPLGDGISSVELVQHIGSDKMIVNAARTSFGAANDEMEWNVEDARSGEVLLRQGDDNFDLLTYSPERLAAFYEAVGDRTQLGDLKITGPHLPLRDAKLIRYLLRHHHGSPLEHTMLTFRITWPVFLDRQAVRHRAGVSKNEESGRYIELDEEFYIPLRYREQAASNRQASVEAEQLPEWHGYNKNIVQEAYEVAWNAYQDLLKRGVAREQARMVLPLGLYVTSYYTFNVRSLLHFIGLRDHEGSQYEMRLFARALSELAEPLFPVTFREWRALQEAK